MVTSVGSCNCHAAEKLTGTGQQSTAFLAVDRSGISTRF